MSSSVVLASTKRLRVPWRMPRRNTEDISTVTHTPAAKPDSAT